MTSTEAGRLAGRPAAFGEPFGRAERLHLAVLAGLFFLLAAMLSAGAIAFTSLSGQILGLQTGTRAAGPQSAQGCTSGRQNGLERSLAGGVRRAAVEGDRPRGPE